MTAADTPSREGLADRLRRAVDMAHKDWSHRPLLLEAITALRLAAKPADDGVLQAWMARHKQRGLDPNAVWTKEPPTYVKDMHAQGGWEIVPVEIRALSTKAKP